jgi:manganese transport protein
VLSLQLPFAMVPLVRFTGDRAKMGRFATGPATRIAAWTTVMLIVMLNGVMLATLARRWAD